MTSNKADYKTAEGTKLAGVDAKKNLNGSSDEVKIVVSASGDVTINGEKATTDFGSGSASTGA